MSVEFAMRHGLVCLLWIATALPNAALSQTCQIQYQVQPQVQPANPAAKSCIQIHTLDVNAWSNFQSAPTRSADLNDATPWIAQVGVAPPLDAKPADTGAALRTSLGQWRDFETQIVARRIDEAKAMNKSLSLPKAPVVTPSPVELWTTLDITSVDQKSAVGADYKWSKSTTFGFEATRAEARSINSASSTQDDKVAARVSLNPTALISLDARTQWETAITGAAKTDTNSVSIAPKFKIPMHLSNGQTLEPFVSLKDELSNSPSAEVGQTKNAISAGTGVTFAKPGSYTMSLTADAENLGLPDPATYKSRFQLTVPLK